MYSTLDTEFIEGGASYMFVPHGQASEYTRECHRAIDPVVDSQTVTPSDKSRSCTEKEGVSAGHTRGFSSPTRLHVKLRREWVCTRPSINCITAGRGFTAATLDTR